MEQESQINQDMPTLEDMLDTNNVEVPIPPEEAVVLQAFQEIQQVEAEKAAEKPKKLSKREEIEKLLPEGIQLYYDHLTQRPRVGDKVTIRSPKLHDEQGNPIAGKYGVGPIILTSKVASMEQDKSGKCINKVVCESGQELILRRTGQWDKTEDVNIKKPHKRHIVLFREKYDEISDDLLEKIKQLSSKKRKTERELKAAENKKSKAVEKKEAAAAKKKKPAAAAAAAKGKPKKKVVKKAEAPALKKRRTKAKEPVESSDSTTDEVDSSSEEEESKSEEVPVEIIVDKLAERVESIIDEKLSKILGKRKREAAPAAEKKAKRPAKKQKKSSK